MRKIVWWELGFTLPVMITLKSDMWCQFGEGVGYGGVQDGPPPPPPPYLGGPQNKGRGLKRWLETLAACARIRHVSGVNSYYNPETASAIV